MVRAVVFDMDGLIVDTETPDYLCWREIYAQHGATLTPEEYAGHVGVRLGPFDPPEELERRCGRRLDREALRSQHLMRYLAMVEADCGPLPGFRDLLGALEGAGYPRAVASTATRGWVNYILSRLEVTGRFDAVVSGDDVARGKPHPDVYLLAAERLGMPPEHCLAIEDSEPGIAAAHAAGMPCVVIPNPLTRHQDLSAADYSFPSLSGITPEFLARAGVRQPV